MHRLALLLGFVAACGGNDSCPVTFDAAPLPDSAPPDPACGGAACGGDLTGTWTIIASCAVGEGNASFFGCAPGTVRFGEFDVTGTWTIDAAGAITIDAAEHATVQAYLPLSCYAGFDCPGLEVLASSRDGLEASCEDRGPTDPATCEVVADACDCAISLDDPDVMLDATIVTGADGTFTVTMGDEVVDGEYCATGDTLWMHGVRFGGVDYWYVFTRAT